MINSEGQEDSETFSTYLEESSLGSGELIPGGKKEGTLVFEQNIGDNGLILNYYYTFIDSKPQIIINLN